MMILENVPPHTKRKFNPDTPLVTLGIVWGVILMKYKIPCLKVAIQMLVLKQLFSDQTGYCIHVIDYLYTLVEGLCVGGGGKPCI